VACRTGLPAPRPPVPGCFGVECLDHRAVVVLVDPPKHVISPPDRVGNLVDHPTEFLESVVVRVDQTVGSRAIKQNLDLRGEFVASVVVGC